MIIVVTAVLCRLALLNGQQIEQEYTELNKLSVAYKALNYSVYLELCFRGTQQLFSVKYFFGEANIA